MDEDTIVSGWGNWALDRDERILLHVQTNYRVDFINASTCAGMLDLIFQVEKKRYSPEDVGDFVRALADIFDPQVNLCSSGHEKPFNAYQKLQYGMEHGFRRSR